MGNMKVAVYSTTPIAGAPFLQYQCLKKYTDLDVHHIGQRNKYADGRLFPKDMFISEARGRSFIKQADIIHIHNYLPSDLEKLIDWRRQKVVATLHSVPRQGNWQHLTNRVKKVFTIRQPMQLREYRGFPSLPNLFDIWEWTPEDNKDYSKIKIVYCPSNKHPDNQIASKGFLTVMPKLHKLQQKHGTSNIGIIHHTGMEYWKNLRLKRHGHIVIDDIIGDTWHLTSLEGAAFGQVSLTSVRPELGFPFIHTTLKNLDEVLDRFLDNVPLMKHQGQKARAWTEENWDPKEQVKEYLKVYESL
mgnify:FL=1